jgi:hypothetical protein
VARFNSPVPIRLDNEQRPSDLKEIGCTRSSGTCSDK